MDTTYKQPIGNPNFSGVSSDYAVRNTIPADTLSQSQKPIEVPQQKTVDFKNPVNAAVSTALTAPKEYTTPSGAKVDTAGNIITPAPQSVEVERTSYGDRLKSALSSLGFTDQKPESLVEINKKLQEEQGIVEKQKLVDDLTAQLNTLTANAEAKAIGLEGQGRGIPITTIQGQISAIDRERAIKSLPLTAQLNAAQGRLETAKQNINTLLELQYKDQQAIREWNNTLYDRAYQIADKEDQRALDLWKIKKDDEATEKKNFTDTLNSLAKPYLDNGDITTASKIVSVKDQTELNSIINTLPSIQGDLTYRELPDGRAVMLDKSGNVVKEVARENVGGMGGTAQGDLFAYASNYADTGKLPSPAELKLSGISVGQVTEYAKQIPKADGSLVSKITGIKTSSISPSQEDGISALYDLTKKLEEAKTKFSNLSTGIFAGLGKTVVYTKAQQEYDTLKGEIVDLLARARSGAALTESEVKIYSKKLPGRFNQSFFLGGKGETSIEGLKKSISGKLDTNLNTNNLALYGYSKVKVNGVDRIVGEVLDIGGVQYKVLPDGNLTDII